MASPSDSPLFSGRSYFCLLFPFSQWNSETEAWQVCCPESQKQVVKETLSGVLICQELGTKPDAMSERKWSSSVLQRALAKRITTLTIRWQIERGPGRHISHQQASNEEEEEVLFFFWVLAHRPFICREAWNLQLFLSFFLILPQLPRESCLFLGPPNNPTQRSSAIEKCRTVPLYWATKWPLTSFREKLEQCIA